MLIREVILENFMSYDYARIPLKPGLNIICGPNGAGKSSILLAVSVALGQVYTERSRKLSDLIRWGKDGARVTVVFDNTRRNNRRPVPRFDVDFFRLSRYLKRDGSYWFEANFQAVNKSEVTSILSEFGINPDNMLIIMHQHMMEEFGIINPKQKLVMMEEAVGLGDYRRNLLEALEKLSQALSEEESVKSLLENAEQTLEYWREEYEKFRKRKDLLHKKQLLERELVWSQLTRQEEIVEGWKNRVKRREEELAQLQIEIEKTRGVVLLVEETMKTLHYEQRKSYHTLLILEKEKTEYETLTKVYNETLTKITAINETPSQSRTSSEQMKDFEGYISELNSQIDFSRRRLDSVEKNIPTNQLELERFDEKIELNIKNYVEARVREGILDFRRENAENEIRSLNRELRTAQKGLEDLKPLVDGAGARVKTTRSPQEVSEDIKITNVQLVTLGNLSEDAEKMYRTYLNTFNELKEKSIVVSENREKTIKEIEERKQTWKKLIQSLLDDVSITYSSFLARIDAVGKVRLTNSEDIEAAGLELVVGFKGAEPTVLDAYTQSGGERSASTMAFLLALQQHVKSPFRAVDEFDVHMDPRNREVISEMLFREISKNTENQYLTITPGQITAINENVNVITVQSVEGKSEVQVVK
ncbi:MAG: hypothetical protein QG670_1547 [Thermoproteota archaeon]|nr:hypothetical protein [Thermoproteota archaeon]